MEVDDDDDGDWVMLFCDSVVVVVVVGVAYDRVYTGPAVAVILFSAVDVASRAIVVVVVDR